MWISTARRSAELWDDAYLNAGWANRRVFAEAFWKRVFKLPPALAGGPLKRRAALAEFQKIHSDRPNLAEAGEMLFLIFG